MIPSDDQLHHDDSVVGIRNSNRVSRARLTEVVLGYLARNPKWVQIGIWSVVLGSTAVGIGLWIGDYLDITDVGYLATFYLNLVGAATIIMPLPGVLAACVAAEPSLGLHPMIIGFVGAVGATLGETTAYLAGFAGQNAAMKFRWYSRIHDLMERNGAVTLFAVSLIPTPFFDLAGIAAGALLYPYRKFLIYVFAGKLIRLIIMAYACRSGIEWLRDIFELNLPIG